MRRDEDKFNPQFLHGVWIEHADGKGEVEILAEAKSGMIPGERFGCVYGVHMGLPVPIERVIELVEIWGVEAVESAAQHLVLVERWPTFLMVQAFVGHVLAEAGCRGIGDFDDRHGFVQGFRPIPAGSIRWNDSRRQAPGALLA